jgi:hypothetical protein
LPTFREALSAIAQKSLEEIGVKVLITSKVEQIDAEGVIVNGQRIYSKSVLWAAGVTASPAAKWLKAEADNAGRVKVADDLSVPIIECFCYRRYRSRQLLGRETGTRLGSSGQARWCLCRQNHYGAFV